MLFYLETLVLRFTFLPYYRQNNFEKNLDEHTPENYGLLQVLSYNKFFDSTARFPKTRTQFPCYNIARNEEGFGVLLFKSVQSSFFQIIL